MKFTIALSLIAGAAAAANPFVGKTRNTAKTNYAAKLVSKARRLNDGNVDVDISGYSVKFEKCQFIKSYSDELAENDNYDTVLATQRFVIFKLCPNNSCSSCNSNYGEYMVDLASYLEATVNYEQELQQEMCNACEECAAEVDDAADDAAEDANDEEAAEADDAEADDADAADDGGRRRKLVSVDCSTCADECDKIENMEANGYIDATEFLECQLIYDPEDDSKTTLYAGPMCASSGSKIKIGVFLDEECGVVDNSKNVDDYLVDGDGYQMKLSHALLKTVYSDTCISCLAEKDDDGNNNNNDDDGDEVLDMCEELYNEAAKCETSNGFSNGYAAADANSNQAAQEDTVCAFIKSVEKGSYDDEGEIALYGANKSAAGSSSTTGGQKFALTFFILGTVGLAVYAGMLHQKLTKGGKAGLSAQGGAMA